MDYRVVRIEDKEKDCSCIRRVSRLGEANSPNPHTTRTAVKTGDAQSLAKRAAAGFEVSFQIGNESASPADPDVLPRTEMAKLHVKIQIL